MEDNSKGHKSKRNRKSNNRKTNRKTNTRNNHNNNNTTKVAALQTVASCNEGTEIEHLRQENRKLQTALEAVVQEAGKMSGYYKELVWVARGGPDRHHHPLVQQNILHTHGPNGWKEFMYDVDHLGCPQVGDWHHGFNSGCLAMSRLMQGLASATDDQHYSMISGVDGEEERARGDDSPGHDWIDKVPQYTWTAQDQRDHALDHFPDLDT